VPSLGRVVPAKVSNVAPDARDNAQVTIMTLASAGRVAILAIGLINDGTSTPFRRLYLVYSLRYERSMSKQVNSSATGAQTIAKTELSNDSRSPNDAMATEPQPRRRSDLNYRTIEGQTVILNREGGRLHQLNETASLIWNCCDGVTKTSVIVDCLVDAYEVDAITARKAVDDVLSQLRSAKLLERCSNESEQNSEKGDCNV
jgi:hypothetical protein